MPVFESNKQAVKYLKKKGRYLPIHECLVNSEWRHHALGTFLLSRKMPSGNYAVLVLLIDIYCLGIKDVIYQVNMDDSEYEDFKERITFEDELVPMDVHQWHNIVYGAHDFAEEYGFKPHKDFSNAEYLLDPELITDEIDEIEFGREGVPYYVPGSRDSPEKIQKVLKTLERTAGKGNFLSVYDEE